MKQIQLVEGNAKHAKAISSQLEKRGFGITLSTDIEEAKKNLEDKGGDLLIIDLNISNNDFLDFYRWLLETPILWPVPRLFITSDQKSDTALKLAVEEKEEILSKPLDAKQFNEAIEKLLRQKSQVIVTSDDDYLAAMMGRKIGSVVIQEEIARGGMGAVFLGIQESLNRQVAVKLLLPSMVGNPYATQRFRREAVATAKLRSPHIVQIYDFGEIDNHVFFITMEFLEGQTLEELLKTRGKLPLDEALSIVAQVARGLSTAHEAGLVHRDIKPSNLIIDAKGRVTITDFGLVRPQHQLTQTQTGLIVGTPQYLPPEQAVGKPLDARSDIYALGIVFYQLLTGKPPFSGSNTIEVMMKHIQEPIPDLRKSVPEIPDRLGEIVRRMTAKDANDRYNNCQNLLIDLESLDEWDEWELDDAGGTTWLPGQEQSTAQAKSRSFILAPSFANIFSQLESMFPSLFQEDRLQGTATLTQAGTFLNQQGKFPKGWLNTLYILQESTKQINAAARLGQWRFEIVKPQDQLLALFPLDNNLGALLLTPQDSQPLSSASVLKKIRLLTPPSAPQGAMQQIASVTGLQNVLLFNQQGELLAYQFKDSRLLEAYRSHLSPVARIFQSISVGIVSMDIWFEKGRVLLWRIDGGILFLIAAVDTSHSFLSTIIAANLERLKELIKSAPPKKEKKRPEVQAGKSLMPTALMDQVQLELARMIGPMAKVVLQNETKKLGHERSKFPYDQAQALVKNLAASVGPEKQEKLAKTLQDLIHEFRSKKR